MEYFALIIALFAYLGPIQVEYHDALPATVWAGNATAHPYGLTYCEQGVPRVSMLSGSAPYVLAHELLHAADCKDDGLFNGSLDPTKYEDDGSDPTHHFVNWALRWPDTATRMIEQLPR